jgi:2-pyrone-4,6-dicarboxylate lactonase
MNDDKPLSAAHDPNPRKPAAAVPPLACDCHAHVFGPGNAYPFIPHGLYTPADALPDDFARMRAALGVQRGVLVQPSIYGADNRAMLDALARDPKNLRGVAVLPFDVSTDAIERLHAQGVRGLRSNIVDLKFDKGVLPLDGLRALGERIKPFGWHLEFLMHVNEFPNLHRDLGDFPVPLVFGHLGYVPAALGTETTGFKALIRLMKDGKAFVKLTAPYRLSLDPLPYSLVDPFAQALVESAPEQLVWGSDWPHTYIKTAMPNDGDLFDLFARWVPDEALRKRILVDNPERLYGF